MLCDDPGFIENGQRDRNAPFVCGLIVPFTCDAGFSLMGAPYISCQTTGKWDLPGPRCVSTGNPHIYTFFSDIYNMVQEGANYLRSL